MLKYKLSVTDLCLFSSAMKEGGIKYPYLVIIIVLSAPNRGSGFDNLLKNIFCLSPGKELLGVFI